MPNWKKVIVSGSNATLNHITASGDIIAGGNSIVTGDLTTDGILYTDDIRRLTDNSTSTRIQLGGNNLYIYAGSATNAHVNFRSTFGTVFNDGGQATYDFRVEGDTDSHLIFADAGNDKVAIGTSTVGDSLLTIDGDVTATNITASGTISASGYIYTQNKIYSALSINTISTANGGLFFYKDNNFTFGDIEGTISSQQGDIVFTPNGGNPTSQEYLVVSQSSAGIGNANALIGIGRRARDTSMLHVGGNAEFDTHITASGNISASGNITSPASKIGFRDLDWQGNIDGGTSTYAQGDVIYHATATSTTQGEIYAMNTLGVVVPADADAVSTSSTILCVALSTNATLGLLLRGTVVLRTSPGANPGQPIYLSTTAGQAQAAAPSETGDVVRVLGYQLTPNGEGDQVNVCYFNPDNTWVELT